MAEHAVTVLPPVLAQAVYQETLRYCAANNVTSEVRVAEVLAQRVKTAIQMQDSLKKRWPVELPGHRMTLTEDGQLAILCGAPTHR